MPSHDPFDPTTQPRFQHRIDHDLRKMEAKQLGWTLGDAIRRNDPATVAYVLGRVDQELARGWRESEMNPLRDAACAYLDLYPALKSDPEPDEAEASVTPISS